MNILVIAGNNYPSPNEPQKGTFVYKLIQEFVKQGHQVIVFAPCKMFSSKLVKEVNYGIEKAAVLRPKYFSLSNKQILGYNTYHIGRRNLIRVLKTTYNQLDIEIDIIYAHFISNALMAVDALQKYNVPIFAAVGEYKNIDVVRAYYERKKYYNLINKIKAFIAVSPQVKQKLIDLKITSDENCILAPNGVNTEIFKPVFSNENLRKQLKLPTDKKIVLFVGRFHHDKGPLRVLEALEKLGNNNYTAIFLGVGYQVLKSQYIHFQGTVKNEDVAKYMAAADLFVLPTLHEGSSNVIVEAMSSGLPIISSNIPEIMVQCNDSFSILIDPLDSNEIARAINRIFSNEILQKQMSIAARKHANNFSLESRCKNILEFFGERLKK